MRSVSAVYWRGGCGEIGGDGRGVGRRVCARGALAAGAAVLAADVACQPAGCALVVRAFGPGRRLPRSGRSCTGRVFARRSGNRGVECVVAAIASRAGVQIGRPPRAVRRLETLRERAVIRVRRPGRSSPAGRPRGSRAGDMCRCRCTSSRWRWPDQRVDGMPSRKVAPRASAASLLPRGAGSQWTAAPSGLGAWWRVPGSLRCSPLHSSSICDKPRLKDSGP